jgi:hypothetical protein
MATISKTGIQDGLTSKAEHITRIIDALDGTATTDVVATGSFTGSFDGIHTGTITSASYAVTASYAENAGGGASKLHLPFMDPAGGSYLSGRTLGMGNGSVNRISGTPSPSNVENYFQVPITGTVVSASIAFQANGGTVTEGNVQVSLFNLDTNVSESLFNSIGLFAATTSSIIDSNLTVNAGDRIAMIVDIGTLAGSVGADGRINGTALLVES